MTTWVKEFNNQLHYATASEFPGVPNPLTHEAMLRDKDYMPLRDSEHEDREGYKAVPATWHKEEHYEDRDVPQQVIVEDWSEPDPETGERHKTGEHEEIQIKPKTFDISWMQVDSYDYQPLPEPPPPPDTSLRDNAEKAIVGRIASLALKYNAMSDLAELDLTIPNLLQLAVEKNVTDEDMQSVKADVSILVLDLMAKEGGTWQVCWDGMKSRFVQWMQEINQQI